MFAGLVTGALVFGSTLAANISLNSGAPVEFGQGVVQATSCDHEVTVTPNSKFVNGQPGEFKFSSITLSNLDSTFRVIFLWFATKHLTFVPAINFEGASTQPRLVADLFVQVSNSLAALKTPLPRYLASQL